MMRRVARYSAGRAALLAVALVMVAGGCGPKPKGLIDKPQEPPPPSKVDLTDIRSYARELKHDGVVNIQLVRYMVSVGQYSLAVQHSDTLLKDSPRDEELHFLKGYALRELGQREQAVDEFKKACDIRSGFAESWNAMGITYDQMRKFDEAEKAYMEALKINPNSAKYLNNLGFSYFSRGEYNQAAEAYKKALAFDPSNVQIRNNLGFSYGMLGRYQEAMTEFKQAGREEVALNNMGFVYYMLGYNNHAKDMYAKALEINPEFAKARNNMQLAGGEPSLFPPHNP